jgi:hypothetical protein
MQDTQLENGTNHRSQQLYWRQLVELKVLGVYMRLYRDNLHKWVRRLGIIRAVASSGGIGGWAIWSEHALIWSCIVAASQVVDALQNVLPVIRQHRATADLASALETLFIDAQLEWEDVFSGRLSEVDINTRRHRLQKLKQEAERKHFPEGLEENGGLFKLAQAEAEAYFAAEYSIGGA